MGMDIYKMSSVAKYGKENVIEEKGKGRSEVQSTSKNVYIVRSEINNSQSSDDES